MPRAYSQPAFYEFGPVPLGQGNPSWPQAMRAPDGPGLENIRSCFPCERWLYSPPLGCADRDSFRDGAHRFQVVGAPLRCVLRHKGANP